MNALEVASKVSEEIAVDAPAALAGATDDKSKIIRRLIEKECTELWRRGEWSDLTASGIINTTGTDDEYALPTDFGRFIRGSGVKLSTGGRPLTPLSKDEFNALLPSQGEAKYYRVNGQSTLRFYRYPVASLIYNLSYVKNSWNGNSTDINILLADDYELPFPQEVLIKGVVWRYRKDLGEPYQDDLAEYEAALEQYDVYDSNARL